MAPEEKINEFVRRVREAAGDNLESVILYGSAASGHFDPEFSDVNLFCVLRETSFAKLQALAPVARWWQQQKQPAPLLMTRTELESTTDVFTIELIDMKAHRRVLFGEDLLERLEIPLRLHRVQVEYELREKLVLLRQRSLLAEKREQFWELLVRSVPSFTTLFRHALIALGQAAPEDKRQVVEALARQVGFAPAAILEVLDLRQRNLDRKKIDINELFARYLDAIEQVTAAVDRALATEK